MKKNSALLMVLITFIASSSFSGTQGGQDLFQKALAKDRAEGKLEEAIGLYQKAIDASENTALKAQAQLRIGLCYEKLGQRSVNLAQEAFQKVIDNYPSQSEEVKIAKGKLLVLPGDGSKASTMTTRQVWAPALDTMGTPSPDGRYISYVNWNKGNLAVHDVQTGENRDLTDEGTWGRPTQFSDVSIWSPDSRQVAYGWVNGPGMELRVVGLDGSKPRVLCGVEPKGNNAPYPLGWSRDGKYILAIQGRKDENLERGRDYGIVLVSVADGSWRVLKSQGVLTYHINLSPDGRYVVSDGRPKVGSKKRDIYLLAADGSREETWIEHPADDSAPLWTPDGKRIVFVSDRSGSPSLWLLDVDDGKPKGTPQRIKDMSGAALMGFARDGSLYYWTGTEGNDIYTAELDFDAGKVLTPAVKTASRFEGSNLMPSWAPDGKNLSYFSRRNLGTRLVIRSSENGQERDLLPEGLRMTVHPARQAPQWSPDGKGILVSGRWRGKYGFYLVDPNTGGFTTIRQDPAWEKVRYREPGGPVFSKDARDIFYVFDGAIMAYNQETQQKRELYRQGGLFGRLAISPDGMQLAFFETDKNFKPTAIKTMPVSGGEPRTLLALQEDNACCVSVGLSWTPDGRYVLIGGSKASELWAIPAEGGPPRKIETGVNITDLSPHPDGRHVAFAGRDPKQAREVWVMENFLPEPVTGM
ncbi:MAG: tetratricopeptide repeat protein [candidate division NC10 bacterium]